MITYGNQALIQKAWGRLEEALAFLRNSRQSSIISLVIGELPPDRLRQGAGSHRRRCRFRAPPEDAPELAVQGEIVDTAMLPCFDPAGNRVKSYRRQSNA